MLSYPSVKPGSMFGYPAYYVNGKLAICHYENGIALKLPAGMGHKLRINNVSCKPFCPMGKKMGDNWVIIYPTEARDIHQFSGAFKESITFLRKMTD